MKKKVFLSKGRECVILSNEKFNQSSGICNILYVDQYEMDTVKKKDLTTTEKELNLNMSNSKFTYHIVLARNTTCKQEEEGIQSYNKPRPGVLCVRDDISFLLPMTTKKKFSPVHIRISDSRRQSTILCEQIHSTREKEIKLIKTLKNEYLLKKIENALSFQFGKA